MKAKLLFEDTYRIVGVMEGDRCPADDFLMQGEKSTEANRIGLNTMLAYVASNGLQNMSHAWSHEVDKENGIFEFIKGPLRLLYFKGVNDDIAVCTVGVRKKTQKVDKAAVAQAVEMKKAYLKAVHNKTYEVVEDEDK